MVKFKISDEDPEKIFKVFGSVNSVRQSVRYKSLCDRAQGPSFKAWNRHDQHLASIELLKEDLPADRAFLETELADLEQCHSPFIVSYKGTYRKQGYLWIVTEYCAGGALNDFMKICDVVLDEEQIACVMKMALQGLDCLHSLGVIHRDIKGGSIFITQSGDCKLSNVGLSAELTALMPKRHTMIGSPYWMAPEVLQEGSYDCKVDIWSLGITAIELGNGKPPLADIHPMRALFAIPNNPPPTMPDSSKWSHDFNDFLRVCLMKDHAVRPTARELLAHPFIHNVKSNSVLTKLMADCRKRVETFHRLGGCAEGDADELPEIESKQSIIEATNDETKSQSKQPTEEFVGEEEEEEQERSQLEQQRLENMRETNSQPNSPRCGFRPS